jgi:hypothetical protein
VVSLIRGAWKRLKGVGENKVSSDFPKQILTVFQTSTVPDFNTIFEHLTNMVEIKMRLEPGKDHWPLPDVLLDMAESKYLELHHIDKWNGVTTKANQSAFTAGENGTKPTYRCFNCGSADHMLDKCPKPRNEQQITQRREAYKKENPGSTKSKTNNGSRGGKSNREKKGKFSPPSPSENNRRRIDGKWFNYNEKRKRWFVEKKQPANGNSTAETAQRGATVQVQSPNASGTNSTSTQSTIPTTVSTTPSHDTRRAVRDAALTNATHAINLAMRGVADAYREA